MLPWVLPGGAAVAGGGKLLVGRDAQRAAMQVGNLASCLDQYQLITNFSVFMTTSYHGKRLQGREASPRLQVGTLAVRW
jgi:hypothetical protein